MPEINIRQNEERNRFEAAVDGGLAVLNYVQAGDSRIAYVHTEVPDELEGQGIGSALAKHALEYARDNDLRVTPSCPFVQAYIRRHPEYQDLVSDGRTRGSSP